MAYITLAELKEYLDIQGAGDDALLQALIDSACTILDNHTHTTFEAAADDTHFFDAVLDTDGQKLLLDGHLASITEVKNGGNILGAGDFVPEPRNKTPYNAIIITCHEAWCFADCPTDAIEVTGRWGYSITPDDKVKQIMRRLAGWMYHQKDSQVFNVTSIIEGGALDIGGLGLPPDIVLLMDTLRRRSITAR